MKKKINRGKVGDKKRERERLYTRAATSEFS
jgi:hypothetical protein